MQGESDKALEGASEPVEGLAEATASFDPPVAAELLGEQQAAGEPVREHPVPIVAIGASAGGLEAIEQFFSSITAPSHFAFIIIQHLSPDFKSLMVELLARRTRLSVLAVEDGMAPAANAIHLLPPGKTMTIEAGLLRLAECRERDAMHHLIDEFFVSLASDRGSAATGVVLSGSGRDGSRGARAISRAGGRVLVQLPVTAKFSSMPQSAVEAGCTEEVMAPAAMAPALLSAGPRPPDAQGGQESIALPPLLVECLDRSFGIDFSEYRDDTVQRRVQRRMMLRGFDQLDAYTAFVVDDLDEQEALYQDLLIGVTAFFRDVDAFEAIELEVAPELAMRLDDGEEVRVWVPACATGEEAYSIAIMILAQCSKPLETAPLKIFATDVHRRSLAVAGAGFYSEESVGNVRNDWLHRFFTRRGSFYQVIPAVRRTILCSPHDLLRDRPFTKLQLISCRSLLIHLQSEAQARVLDTFAAAIEPDGHLLLGPGESASSHAAAFATVQRDARLFRRRSDAATIERRSVVAAALPAPTRELTVSGGRTVPPRERRDQRLTAAHQLLLDRYVPPSLLIDENGHVVHCFGDADPYLEVPRGRPSPAVLDMVKDALRDPLSSAIDRVRRTGQPTTLTRLPLARSAEPPLLQRLVVEVPDGQPEAQPCLLVSFDNRSSAGGLSAPAAPDDQAQTRIDELERELGESEASLQATIAELRQRDAALEAALGHLVAAMPEAVAIARQAATDSQPQVVAANAPMAEAARAAGLAMPLKGTSLASLLSGFLGATEHSDLTATLASSSADDRTTRLWSLAGWPGAERRDCPDREQRPDDRAPPRAAVRPFQRCRHGLVSDRAGWSARRAGSQRRPTIAQTRGHCADRLRGQKD